MVRISNAYINSLLDLERVITARIHSEIEDTIAGRGDSLRLKESIIYVLDDKLNGRYKDDEKWKIQRVNPEVNDI